MNNNFKLEPKGKVKLELIDKDGNIKRKETHNMVLDSAIDILVRRMSGIDQKLLFERPILTGDPVGPEPKTPIGLIEEYNYEWETSYNPSAIVKYMDINAVYEGANYKTYGFEYVEGKNLSELFNKFDPIISKHDGFEIKKMSKINTGYGVNFIGISSSSVDELFYDHDIYDFIEDSAWERSDTRQFFETVAEKHQGAKIEFSAEADQLAFMFDCKGADSGQATSNNISIKIDGIDIATDDPDHPEITGKKVKVFNYDNYEDFSNFKELVDNDLEDTIKTEDIYADTVINTNIDENTNISSGINEFVLDFSGLNTDKYDNKHTITITNNDTNPIKFYGMYIDGMYKSKKALTDEIPAMTTEVDIAEMYNATSDTDGVNPQNVFKIDAKDKRIIPNDGTGKPTISVFVGSDEYTYTSTLPNPNKKEFTLLSNNENGYYLDYNSNELVFYTPQTFDNDLKVVYKANVVDSNGNVTDEIKEVTKTFSPVAETASFAFDDNNPVVEDSEVVSVTTTDSNNNTINISNLKPQIKLSQPSLNVSVKYKLTREFGTDYKRATISKPKSGADYPNYDYIKNRVVYEGEFEKQNPNYPISVKQIALMNNSDYLPDEDFSEKAFAMTRIDGLVKRPDDILKVIWEVTFI